MGTELCSKNIVAQIRHWRLALCIGENLSVMKKLNRRDFLLNSSAASLVTAAGARSRAAAPNAAGARHRLVFIGSGGQNGIRSEENTSEFQLRQYLVCPLLLV